MTDLKTIGWIEGLRFIAILMVAIPHFIDMFCPEYFSLWTEYPWLLKGISGKHGVAIFMVIVGYFASKPTEKNLATYVSQRYLQFAINIALMLFLYCIICYIFSPQRTISLSIEAAKDAILLRNEICPTYWCVRTIFWGSVLCYVLGNLCQFKNTKWRLVFVVAICAFLFKTKEVWLAICVLGYVYRLIEDKFVDIAPKYIWMSVIVCCVLVPILYRHNESNLTYFMQGVSCCLTMWVISHVNFLQVIFGNKVMQYLGSLSFYIFLSHTLVNISLNKYMPTGTELSTIATVSTILVFAITPPCKMLNNSIIRKFLRRLEL